MARTDYGHVTRTILEVVSEDRNRRWELKPLAAEVGRRAGYGNLGRLEVMIRTLVCGRKLRGWVRGNSASGIGYREPEASDEAKENIALLQEAVDKTIEERERLKKELEETRNASSPSTIVEVQLKNGRKTVKKMKALFHEKFAVLLDLAKARENIFLFGPTGCGKSFVCAQLAEALDLPFRFISCTAGMSEGQVGGKLLPTGAAGRFEYIVSEFVKLYETGGVFLLDEIDAADPNVLLFINAALASDTCSVPNRIKKPYAKRHPDFICIAAANTAGTGGDRMYSGRNKLDGATLDRFQIGKVMLDYDERVERELTRDPETGEADEDLLTRCHRIRQAINDHRLERAMSTRFIEKANKMKNRFGWSYSKIDDAYFCGWREDEVNKVRASAGI